MKRTLLFGLMALALLAVALPAMAAPSTLGVAGEVTYGVIGTGTTAADGFGNAQMTLTATVDPNNMASLQLYANTLTATENGSTMGIPVVNDFYWQSNIGGILGLDAKVVDPVLSVGYGVYDLPDFNLTQSGPEGIAALGVDSGNADGMFGGEIGHGFGLAALNTSILGMFNVVLAASGTAFTTATPEALAGVYGTVGPVSFEAGWAAKGTTAGYIPIGVKANLAMGDIGLAAMGSYVVNLNAGGVSNWAGGLQASYKSSYTVDFALVSTEPKWATAGIIEGTGDVILTFAPNFGVIGTAWLNLATNAAALFDTFEASVWYSFGPAKIRVGYLYTTATGNTLGNPDLNAPAANGANGGGVFATADMSF